MPELNINVEATLTENLEVHTNEIFTKKDISENIAPNALQVRKLFLRVYTHGGLNFEYVTVEDTGLYESISVNDIVVVKLENNFSDYTKISGKFVKKCELSSIPDVSKVPVIIRKATEEDLENIKNSEADFHRCETIFKQKVKKHKLEMKFVRIHHQFDKHRLFFYYTAEGRVDFRELAKDLAAEFKTRIELRQISYREEARLKGGIGTCGREFCCSSFLHSLKRIPTQIAFDQNMTVNISKLSGPCGKLKCCLLFELDKEKYDQVSQGDFAALVHTTTNIINESHA